MQYTAFVLVALATAVSSVSAGSLAALDRAGASCNSWKILAGSTVQANCLNTVGEQRLTTQINLNQCVGNSDGVLQCQTNGNAGNTCTFSNIQDNNGVVTINASCLNRNSGSQTTSGFPIDNCLTNNNGVLGC